jgi:hypothetical protein
MLFVLFVSRVTLRIPGNAAWHSLAQLEEVTNLPSVGHQEWGMPFTIAVLDFIALVTLNIRALDGLRKGILQFVGIFG